MRKIFVGLALAASTLSVGARAQTPGHSPPLAQASSSAVDDLATSAADSARYGESQRKAQGKYGSLGVVTAGMGRPGIIILCETIAGAYRDYAAAETDAEKRMARLAQVWRFAERLRKPSEDVRKTLGESGYAQAVSRSNEAIGILSMMPDKALASVSPDEMMFAWAASLSERCGQMLDEMGIATITGQPPADFLDAETLFRFRGDDYAKTFANTDLGPYAKQMCRGESGPAPDFTGAPLQQRGKEGMSLLDWAIECDDRASFDKLVAAGFDLTATGLWEDPPLVNVASEKRLWFLKRLLDEGVKPDVMGRTDTALVTASSDLDALNSGGNPDAAFALLRSRGASLNFPDFRGSMWTVWGLHKGRWDLILAHWAEFDSDPVELASLAEFYLSGDMNWAKKAFDGAARQVKVLLAREYGVCFPVGATFDMKTDERGFRIQPDCAKPK